jgi:hypothetical protein
MDTPILIGTGFVILAAFVWGLCAYYAWLNAPKFGRNRVTWTILCVIFGPIALMILYILPKGHKTAPAGSAAAVTKAAHKDPRADLYEVPNKKKHH